MPRRELGDDDESVMTFSFDQDITTAKPARGGEGKGDRSQKQEDQLAAAREVCLRRRRTKLKAKIEARLTLLRSQLGDMNSDQLEKAVTLLVETEDRHRAKLSSLTESLTDQLKQVYDELHALKKGVEKSQAKRVGTLSDVSSVSASVRA